MAISMTIYGSAKDGYHVVATVPGVYNASGGLSAWTIDEPAHAESFVGFDHEFGPVWKHDESVLQNALNKLAASVQRSKPFPKW